MSERTTCAVAGGAPAGMMLALLLARAGIPVTVLEKHADFLRDFRGDTVHPSTLEVMHELGLLEGFLERPHQRLSALKGVVGDTELEIADLSRLPTRCRFIAFMPQWDFLDFLAEDARKRPGFDLRMSTEVGGLLWDGDRFVGLEARGPDGPLEIRADLVVGCDGRHSRVREKAGLSVEDVGAPMDVLWMRLPARPEDGDPFLGRFRPGGAFVTIPRGDYYQCALVIQKGGFDRLKAAGLDALRGRVAELAPFLADRVGAIAGWDDVKLLVVRIDRLKDWARPGLLCIGDAAHAMSPVGGVGINLAVQDAVAAANRLAAPLRSGALGLSDLQAVQRRREWPTRVTQRLQVLVQNRIVAPAIGNADDFRAPWPLRLVGALPPLRRLAGRLVGMGVRPEHVGSAFR
jgi:2-polyprenyl-6-methoxyphenol hydroxylase-like FAD-dependent oxidoreductase